MALLQLPGPQQLHAANALTFSGQHQKLASAAHVGIGQNPHFAFLHCRTTSRRVKHQCQRLFVAVFDVQEVDSEGTGNSERRRQSSGESYRSGNRESNTRGSGRGRGIRGRGGGGRGARGGRGGRISDSASRGYGGDREFSPRGNYRRDDGDQDSQRASSSRDGGSDYGGRGGFRSENGGSRGGFRSENGGSRGGYQGRGEGRGGFRSEGGGSRGGYQGRGEGRGSSLSRGGYAGRNGSSRGGYAGRGGSREENGSSNYYRGGYAGRADSRGEDGDTSYARGSYGRENGYRGDDGANSYSAGRTNSRGVLGQERDGEDFRSPRGGYQQGGRGRGSSSGRNGYRVDTSGRVDSIDDTRQERYGRGSYGERSGARGGELWEGNQEKSDTRGRRGSKTSPQPFQTVTPRQSASEFVSDRTVYKAPWEQGEASEPSPKSFGERDFTKKNPLIERLQKIPVTEEDDDASFESDDAQTRYFDGRGEKSAMSRIVEKLSNIPGSRKVYESRNSGTRSLDGSNIFIPRSEQPMFPGVQRGWSTPDHPIPTPAEVPRRKRPDTRFPWEREEAEASMEESNSAKPVRVKPPSLAELTIPEDELKRLRSLGILARHRIKIGKAGVTNGIVEAIHNEWRDSEIVRVKCEGPPAMNMKRTHEDLEEKSGGLVVWRAGGACLVYRGKDYVPPPLRGLLGTEAAQATAFSEEGENEDDDEGSSVAADDESEKEEEEDAKTEAGEATVVVPKVKSPYDPEMERELEEILASLGPRYDDWTGAKPVPVDADLLVNASVKYKKPYRLLPYGVRPCLSNVEMTDLRRLSRPIPPHFVLGRNRGLDGLAAAIVKLWEKSEIAKIAVKRGVQNTNHERMGEELKRLTGGILLARDKFFIVLYRGKDFLPPSVAAALAERQAMTQALQEEEEKVRLLPRSTAVSDPSEGLTDAVAVAGTLSETLEAKANWEVLKNSDDERINRENARRAAKRDMARRIERKMAITMAKRQKAQLELEKVEKRLCPAGPPLDRELITEEEMHMYLKLGLKMKAFLLLGRRGVFDGTIENMHLHWKHRELVKIIYKARNKIDLEQTAKMLEYESGGILVGTVATSKGQAILMYRGKNYSRPPELRPRSLLTKRQALKRSIELQRQEALERHMLVLEKEIGFMQADLAKLEAEGEVGTDTAADPLSQPEDEEEGDIMFTGIELPEDDEARDSGVGYLSKRGKLDPIFRADALSRKEKLVLRQKALQARKRAAHFNVGGSNVVAGLARAIRIHFQRHALVKIGVKGRAKGTPVEEIIMQLENATGGTLVSQESSKIILYRGWPDGEERPTHDNWAHDEEDIPPELRSAMIEEEGLDERFFDEEEKDSAWQDHVQGDEDDMDDDDEDDDDDDESLDMDAEASFDFEDDSDWDEEDDEDDDEDVDDDDNEDVVSQWQEDGAKSKRDTVSDPSGPDLASGSDTADFEYEDDEDDVDFEWNEVEDEASAEEEDGGESSRSEVSQSAAGT